MCPDRWSKNQGSPSSGKGKAYFTAYDQTDFLVPTGEIYVLSKEDCNELQTIGTTKVVLDTGATESVSGVKSAARLLDEGNLNYKICLRDRPTFRFGNSQSQQAVSKMALSTPALGEVSFYLLDGTAESTPLLLGARDLRERQALIAYKGGYLAHRDRRGTWRASKLMSLRSGHLALSLTSPSTSLSSSLRLRDVRDRGPGGDRDGEDGDEHPPPEDGPDSGQPRGRAAGTKRQHVETSSLGASSAAHSTLHSMHMDASLSGDGEMALLRTEVRETTEGSFGHEQLEPQVKVEENNEDGYSPTSSVIYRRPFAAGEDGSCSMTGGQSPEEAENGEPPAEDHEVEDFDETSGFGLLLELHHIHNMNMHMMMMNVKMMIQ